MRFILVVIFLCFAIPAQATQPTCDISSAAKIRNNSVELYQQGYYQRALDSWKQYQRQCLGDEKLPIALQHPIRDTRDYYSLIDHIMGQQLVTGQYSACTELGIENLDLWMTPLSQLKGTAVYESISHRQQQCLQSFNQHYDFDFQTRSCPIAGFDGVAFPETDTPLRCISLQQNQRETSSAATSAEPTTFTLLLQDGQQYRKQQLNISQGRIANLGLCGINNVATTEYQGHIYIRFDNQLTFCKPSAAKFRYNGIFRLNKQHTLSVVDEILAPLH